jgi:hypothetical protein
MSKPSTWLRQQLDVDQLLIFFLLAVTVSQMGYYLASFQPAGLWWVGYLQAVAIDAAIWRSAWWYRRYRGKKQRRWALAGVVAFSLASGWYNFGFYTMQRATMAWALRLAMGAMLPAGVALLSFLKGQKDESAFAVKDSLVMLERPLVAAVRPSINGDSLSCETCGRLFAWPSPYNDRRAAQNAMNAHRCGDKTET